MKKAAVYLAEKLFFATVLLFFFSASVLFSQNSIFTNQVPTGTGNDSDYELGMKFSTSQVAGITKIMYYKTPGESGLHTGKIWNDSGIKLLEVNFDNESSSGWQYAELNTPFMIFPGNTYVVSVNANSEYAITQNELASSISNGILNTIADNNNGVFNDTPELFPAQSFNNSNYYRDIEAVELNSIFTTELPAGEFNDGPYEMGVKFTASQAAKVRAISYYKSAGESGSHTGNLWTSTGTLIASANFTNETALGWQYAFLSTPVNIPANTVYVVSVNSNTAYAPSANEALASSVSNGILSTVADNNNGVFSGLPNTQGIFPTFSFQNTNYFRDVIVEPIDVPDLPILITPADNATNVSIEPTLNWSSAIGAETYTLELATDVNFSNLVFSSSGLTVTSYSFTELLNNQNYYWRVSAENFAGTSGYSTGTFKTVQAYLPYLAFPTNNVKVYTNPIVFTWYLTSNFIGIKYDLIYSTDPGLNSPTVITNIGSLFYSISGLDKGTTYYWRIRSRTANGAVASYSSINSFITSGEAVTPIPAYPINSEIVYTYSPTLYWYLGSFGVGFTYEIEFVQGDTTNLTGTPTSTNINNFSYSVTGLDPDTKYSWQVRSKSGSTYSSWSNKVSFKTVQGATGPVKPILAWPINDAVVYSTATALHWFIETDGTGLTYELELVEGESFDLTGTPNFLNINALSKTVAGLENGKRYSWSVRSTNGIVFSPWSDPGTFEVVGSVITPTIPILSYPIGGNTVYMNKVNLNWYLASSYTGLTFDIEYGTGPLTGTPTVTGITKGNYEISNLTAGSVYYWRVRSSNGLTNSDWSDTESFSTLTSGNNTVSVPLLSWPIGGATVYSTSPKLFWYLNNIGTGLTYELQYSTHSNMSSPITVPNISSKDYTLSGLSHGTIYYWRVRSYNGLIYSGYSSIEAFVTSAAFSWAVPIAAAPMGGAEISSSSPHLSWFIPTKASVSAYEIEFSKNSDMSNSSYIESSENSKVISGLEIGEKYYWRVRSKNNRGEASEYSEIENFVMPSQVTSVDSETGVPLSFNLMQNYPNPFNPATTFEFSIAEAGLYTLNVYSILGEKVATLIDSEISAGIHKINFDAGKLSSGIYIYTLSGNNLFLSNKMMLLK